jgi:hypothetical protein
MKWQELKEKVYYLDGSWRDIYIPNITKEDWKLWAAYVNENYKIEWLNGKTNTIDNKINFDVILEYWNGNPDLCSTAKIFIDKIQINSHFFDDNELDPREFNGIEDHVKLIKYLTDLTNLFQKEVLLTPENEHDTVLLKVLNGG